MYAGTLETDRFSSVFAIFGFERRSARTQTPASKKAADRRPFSGLAGLLALRA
jgi:hypothetical protein